MMKNKKRHENLDPSADMVLNLLRAEPSVVCEYLSFYDVYIRVAATERIYSVDDCYYTTRFNDDLKQEIDIALAKSLAPLRQKLIQYLNGECILLFVSPDEFFE